MARYAAMKAMKAMKHPKAMNAMKAMKTRSGTSPKVLIERYKKCCSDEIATEKENVVLIEKLTRRVKLLERVLGEVLTPGELLLRMDEYGNGGGENI